MTLLDLDKIIIKRSVKGISCTQCGGNLVQLEKKNLMGKIITVLTFGIKKTKQYACEDCKKKFTVI